jgi:hypothetical protein
MAEMIEFGRQMLATQIRTNHPEWDESAVWKEVRRRWIYGTS